MRGSHRGSPFGGGLDIIQTYTDCISTTGAIRGALNARCHATIKMAFVLCTRAAQTYDGRRVGVSADLVADL